MSSFGFMTAAIGRTYEQFIGPYIASTLITFPAATTEIRVHGSKAWTDSNQKLVASLREHFDRRFVICSTLCDRKANPVVHGTVRWLMHPRFFRPDILYIGDIDIIICEPRLHGYFEQTLSASSVPYANGFRGSGGRDNNVRFIGWQHVAKTEPYYAALSPAILARYAQKFRTMNDERFLYEMCKEVFGLPSPPVRNMNSGVHVSPNRLPLPTAQRPCSWMISGNKKLYQALSLSPVWQDVRQHFSAEYRQKLAELEAVIAADPDEVT